MKTRKLLPLLLTLLLVIGMMALPVSAGSCEACVDEDNNGICDVCGVCYNQTCRDYAGDNDHNCNYCGTVINTCVDTTNNGNHNCTECGKENASECKDDYWGNYEDHICDDCNAPLPCYDEDNNHLCDGCGVIQPNCAINSSDYCADCGAVKINETNFPDSKFRDYLLNYFYSTNDDILTAKEIASLDDIYISSKAVSTLQGIEYLTALEELYAAGNQLITVDLSKNTALTHIDLDNNLLTSIDVSNNPALAYLDLSYTHVSALDLSKNPALTSLSISGTYLTQLDLSNNPALISLSCSDTQIGSLDLSNNPALTAIYCYDNLLTSLVLGDKPVLKTLECYSNQLTALDVTQAPVLETLRCYKNRIAALDLTKCPLLTTVNCYENKLTGLNTSANTKLEYLNCGTNKIVALDLSKNTMLRELRVYSNKLTGLDVSPLTYLTYLDTSKNDISNLDVTKNAYLESLYCATNNLTSIDVSKNTALKYLSIGYNKLTTLDVSNNMALQSLSFYDNLITNLDLSKNAKLSSVSGDCLYPIELDANYQFDLSTLPGNFNPMKASNWDTSFYVSGTMLTMKEEEREYYDKYNNTYHVGYTYDLGNGKSEYFTLLIGSQTSRRYGENRYETAVKVADMLKSQLGVQKFDAVVLANGYNFADALSGSYLAAMKDAPILLTWIGKDKYNYLNEYTVSYVKENLAEGGTVYILGGESAVPKMVDDLLTGYNVKRLAGENRFETNLLILKEAGVKAGEEVLVCTAGGFADSLSASAAGKPILLVHKKLSDSQKAYLGTLQNCSYTMIGGTSAVSDGVKAEFDAYGATTRLAGGNRFETSVKVAEKYFSNVDSVVLAYAKDFPDGLCGGPLAYAMDCPLILTMAKGEAKAAEYVQANDIREGLVLGGDKLISSDSVNKIFND